MNLKKINLFFIPLLMLTSCNTSVSVSHDDFALKAIEFINNGADLSSASNSYEARITGTYEILETKTSHVVDFNMYGAIYILHTYQIYDEYSNAIINYLNFNYILRSYVVYNNSNMKKYYASNSEIKVEDYSLSGNDKYVDVYTWNNEAMPTSMIHYFIDEKTNTPIAKASVTITKVDKEK